MTLWEEKPLTEPAKLFWRLPIIRHIRYYIIKYRINNHYILWLSLGYFETNDFDRKCLDQIWRGIV